MLVSMREATGQASIVVVKFLSRPSSAGSLGLWTWLSLQKCLFSLSESFRALVKQLQSLFRGQSHSVLCLAPSQLHSNAVAGGNPFQFVAWTDTVLVGYLLGHSQLKLRCDLWHNPYFIKEIILTASRKAARSHPEVS